MADNKNQGFVNLRAIHELQVGGSIQAILREIRAAKVLLDQVKSELNLKKKKQLILISEKEEKAPETAKVSVPSQTPNESQKPIEYKDGRRDFNKTNFRDQKPFNSNRPFNANSQFNKDKNTFNRNQNQQNPNFKPFNKFEKPNFDKNKTNKGTFAASRGNNFKSFEAEPIAPIDQNNRTFGNKNKSPNRQNLEEKKQVVPNKRVASSKNIFVNDGDDFEEVVMGSRKLIRTKKEKQTYVAPVIDHAIINTEKVSVKTLSEKTGKPATEIIKKLMMLGIMATINSLVDFETAELALSDMGITLELKLDKTFEDQLNEIIVEDKDENLISRPPVVTVMGHVDHGKTSLLDAIRKTNIAVGEAGGITQRIGAYTVTAQGKKITFVDTPGHAAFTAMRARGAKITDVAVLVVAADDGIMPQTIEAIDHIKAANVPMIVAINKMDKPEANPERIKQQLAEHNVLPEEWGGDTILVPISAKTGMGIDKLLETILLVAEIQDLKANPSKMAAGCVIEAELDKNRGPVASLLVQNGTLKVGDNVVCGLTYGKIRAMFGDNGKQVKVAGPSEAVSVLGFQDVPNAGDKFAVVDEKLSKQVIEERINKIKEERANKTSGVSLDDFMSKVNEGKLKSLNIIIKADVQGSVEALKQTLTAIENDEVRVNCIHSGAGFVTESDVILASASNAIIIAFNVKVGPKAEALAKTQNVEIKDYKVIYDVVDDITLAINGMKTVKYQQVVIGHAEVRAIFKLSSVGYVVGCYIQDGKATRNSFAKVTRNGELVVESQVESLKVVKDDKAEVVKGFECGVRIKDANLVKEGDLIEFYINEPIKD